ncbi:unnamed protein product [Penicillium olsonii]|nr:unnamed protein product [Penicillium olsonii]
MTSSSKEANHLQIPWYEDFTPCQFDWADDVEDSLERGDSGTKDTAGLEKPIDQTVKKEVFTDLSPSRFNWANDVEDSLERGDCFDDPTESLDCQLYRTHPCTSQVDLTRSELIGPQFERSVLPTISEEDEEAYCSLSERNSREPNSPLDSRDDEVPSGDKNDNETDERPLAFLQQCYDELYAEREKSLTTKEIIHHFSWVGYPVSHYSATKPSESLAIILSDPKAPRGSSKYRIQAITENAFTLVDPVILYLDGIGHRLFQLRGSQLIKASEGRVFKFYSPHGVWMDDTRETEEDTAYDPGSLAAYQDSDAVVGNGFHVASIIRPVVHWENQRLEAFEEAERCRGPPRRRTWEPRLSPLSQCETIPTVELPQRNDGQPKSSSLTECEMPTPLELPGNRSPLSNSISPSLFDIIKPMGLTDGHARTRKLSDSSKCETAVSVETPQAAFTPPTKTVELTDAHTQARKPSDPGKCEATVTVPVETPQAKSTPPTNPVELTDELSDSSKCETAVSVETHQAAFTPSSKPVELTDAHTRARKPSDSSQCETTAPVESPRKHFKSSNTPKKRPWKPRTTIPLSQATTASKDGHHEVVSFPPPVFRRPSKTKRVLKAVMRIMGKVVYAYTV